MLVIGKNDGRFSGYLTYTPEWEGTVRLAYRPDVRWAIFGQLHYTGTMYTAQLGGGDLSQESALTQLDLGVKYQPTKDWQLTVGVNDLFNKQQDLYQNACFVCQFHASISAAGPHVLCHVAV